MSSLLNTLIPGHILAVLNAGVIVVDHLQRICYWNRWMEIHSIHAADTVLMRPFYDVFPMLSVSRVAQAITGAIQQGRSALLSHALNPHPFPLYASVADQQAEMRMQQALAITPIHMEEGQRYCLIQISDMTAAVRRETILREQAIELANKIQAISETEGRLRESEARFRQLAEVAPVGIFEAGENGRLRYINSRLREWCGLASDEQPDTLLPLVHPEDQAQVRQEWQAARNQQRAYEGEFRFVAKDGSKIWVHTLAAPILQKAAQATEQARFDGFVGTVTDISERKALEIHHEYLAYHDGLTGLPNRLHVLERIRTTLLQRHMDQGRLALLYLDLDKFKAVNDQHGHAVGDSLLIAASQRMLACVRSSDCVARLGGDEFVVLLSSLPGPEVAIKVAEKLIEALSLPFELSGLSLRVGTSIGIAMTPEDGQEVNELIAHADAAMYSSKQHGRGHYRFYSQLPAAERADAINATTGSALYE
ncbi:diguanylate cyclase domain-containing protein [Parvibium lacunae]|uniref:Sensor domain-containing diguanylate cyclase n=1 Tax=Parvibium lacunae TaxID=1888893 RepID=A0A368L7W6_9BURK|nr:diguanylate cyclase [Parvibium lacunae]RCS59798.1 sensor domain-containing diguanylate cyclase [Parvibium lacunae]